MKSKPARPALALACLILCFSLPGQCLVSKRITTKARRRNHYFYPLSSCLSPFGRTNAD